MYRKQIDEWIESRQEELIEDLKRLIRIDSQRGEPSPGNPFGDGPAAVLDAAGEMMEKYGLKVTHYDHYVVTGDYGTGEKELDILAHLDVVPVSDEWTVTMPFEPVVRDGRVYIEKEAPSTFTPDANFPLINLEKARLAKSFTCEPGQETVTPRVTSLHSGSKVNVVPADAQAVLVGLAADQVRNRAEEITRDMDVICTVTDEGEKVRVAIKGSAAHGSTPELGQNALTALLQILAGLNLADCASTRVLKGLAALYPHGDTCGQAIGVKMQDEISGALTMNLGILNLSDGKLYGEFDVRAPLCATDDNLTKVIRSALSKAGLVMEAGGMVPAHYVPADSPLVQKLLASYEAYFGEKGTPLATGGGTYVHGLKRGVAFGCEIEGIDNHMHGDDEFADIDVLVKSAKIFADAIIRICG